MKLQVKFSQEQIEEALREIITSKFRNEQIKFDKFEFRTTEIQFRGPDRTEATVTIEI